MVKKIYTVRFRQDFIEAWTRSTATFLERCERLAGESSARRIRRARNEEQRSAQVPARDERRDGRARDRRAQDHPTWGPRKLGPWLLTKNPDVELPAASTMGGILKRAGLVPPRKRRKRTPRYSEPFVAVEAPNDVWTADFKGQFHTRDGLLCYPLTIADCHSRFLLRCDAYKSPDAASRASFESAFIEFGLPRAIRTDNGTPFAVSRAPAGISALSVWWIRLGIMPERITPASPWLRRTRS